VAQLEDQLEQMSSRLRHAYSQAEAAQALVSDARQRGDLSPESSEMMHLRTELDQLRTQLTTSMARVHQAEERATRAESNLLALKAGVDLSEDRVEPDDASPDEPAVVDDGKRELSLRSRLARTATRKKQRDSEDDEGGLYG
jgi:predicted  nucleic acid-binding Zn-ribbon protein